MANPWDDDEIVQAAPATAGNPWDVDEIVAEPAALEIDIVGGTPVSAQDFARQAQPSFAEREGRGAGLLARSAAQSVGGLVGAIGGDAFNAYVVDPIRRQFHSPTMSDLVTGNDQFQPSPSFRDIAGSWADRAGLPRPESALERVSGDVNEALLGTATTMGIGGGLNALANLGRPVIAPVTNRLAQLLTSQPGYQVAGAVGGSGAGGITRESGGSQGQQLAASLAGGLGPGLLGASGAATLRGSVRGADGSGMQQTIDDFRAVGANPSVGQASGNRFLQGAENILSKAPTSSGVLSRFSTQQAEDIGQGLTGLSARMSPRSSGEQAGRAIERGVDTFRGNSRAQQRALYWAADRHIPDQTPVAAQNTWQEVVRLTTPTPGAAATTGAMIHPRIAQLRENLAQDFAAGGGQLPYSALRAIRTQIGEQISDFSMTPDAPTRQLRQLYGVLSRDMDVAAQAAGPEAAQAARRANNYTRVLNERLEQVQRVIDKNGGPEKVFSAAMSGTRDGGTTLRAVMQSLPPEGQRAVTAATIRRMGLASPGQQDVTGEVFSSNKFMTNWNTMSDEAKRALFHRHGPTFTRDMDRIARVADNIKQGAEVFRNASGSAHVGAAYGYWISMLGALGTGNLKTAGGLALGGATANGAARLFTQPWAVRWLANSTALPTGSAVAQAQALGRLAEQHGDPEVGELAKALEEQARNDQGNTRNAQQQ
ncbi:hypothetical protein ACYX7E_09895 [Luteimonas sp. RIT-PG2_3]